MNRFEADLYAYGLAVGAALLRRRRFNRAIRYLIRPVPYWRSLEYRLVWSRAAFSASDRVLDIGSPKLLSLYLADRVGAEVFSTDLEPYFIDEYEYLAHARGVPEERFHAVAADGRALPYDDDSFTAIYSISVIEHIPDSGDSACLAEIGRVLSPGGRCLITVPFWPTSRDQFREPDFYWAADMPATQDGRVFFQRRYSHDDLIERLVRPSGLELSQTLFVGERVMLQSEREFDDVLPVITGPIQPLLSRAVHTRPVKDARSLRKPLCAFLLLTKPPKNSGARVGELTTQQYG